MPGNTQLTSTSVKLRFGNSAPQVCISLSEQTHMCNHFHMINNPSKTIVNSVLCTTHTHAPQVLIASLDWEAHSCERYHAVQCTQQPHARNNGETIYMQYIYMQGTRARPRALSFRNFAESSISLRSTSALISSAANFLPALGHSIFTLPLPSVVSCARTHSWALSNGCGAHSRPGMRCVARQRMQTTLTAAHCLTVRIISPPQAHSAP